MIGDYMPKICLLCAIAKYNSVVWLLNLTKLT